VNWRFAIGLSESLLVFTGCYFTSVCQNTLRARSISDPPERGHSD
jgi:hypothetical protein